MSLCPAHFSIHGQIGIMLPLLMATGSGMGLMQTRMLLWTQTNEIAKCRRRPRAYFSSLVIPGTLTAPCTPEMHREETQGDTSLGWRGVLYETVTKEPAHHVCDG